MLDPVAALEVVRPLTEISTELASVRLRDSQLESATSSAAARSLPTLFLLASPLAGSAVLPAANKTDIYLTALGALLTVVYMIGLIFRPRRLLGLLGIDSAVVAAIYVIGVVGLVFVAR